MWGQPYRSGIPHMVQCILALDCKRHRMAEVSVGVKVDGELTGRVVTGSAREWEGSDLSRPTPNGKCDFHTHITKTRMEFFVLFIVAKLY